MMWRRRIVQLPMIRIMGILSVLILTLCIFLPRTALARSHGWIDGPGSVMEVAMGPLSWPCNMRFDPEQFPPVGFNGPGTCGTGPSPNGAIPCAIPGLTGTWCMPNLSGGNNPVQGTGSSPNGESPQGQERMSLIDLVEQPIDIAGVTAAVERPEAGAIATFLGTVRDHNEGRRVVKLEYEAYPSMALEEMRRIAREIANEIPEVRLAVAHRTGVLAVGDIAVVCAASAPHRDEAYRACRALIDRVKARVPIWKREHGPEGAYWVGWQDARCEAGPGHEHPR